MAPAAPARRPPRARTAALAALLGALLAQGPVGAEEARATPELAPLPSVVPGSFVVRTEEPVRAAERRAIAEVAGGVPGPVIAPDTFVVEVAPTRAAGADVLDLEATPAVADVHPELLYAAADTDPGDPCWRGACTDSDGPPSVGGQAELRTVGAARAWDVSRGSADVVVAVLDTRIETSPPHRDLVGKLLPGRSFVADASCTEATSARDHGTIAAGLIAAQPGNGGDIAGLGWDTRVLPVEVLDDCGSGTTSAVAAGIRWAADAGADIINLSLTGGSRDPVVSEAIAYARGKGLLVVAAAGNHGGATPVWPAADLGVVAVAATGVGTSGEDRIAPFSNFGPWVDIAAPGVDVTGLRRDGGSTTWFDGTVRASGTSFAAPIVAAAAALVMAHAPELSAEQVVARLAQSAAQIPGSGSQFLWGRLDVAAALDDLPHGYRLVTADGGVHSFGDAPFVGSTARPARAPVVGGASHVSGRGSWLAGSDGGVHPLGVAPDFGSAPPQPPGRPVVGMAATPGGDGYWLVTRDGRVLPFGSAADLGSRAGMHLNQPIVGMATGPRGDGYWLLGRDGGIFSFGDTAFLGSTGGMQLNQPIVGMAPTPSGAGYWLVAGDGGIFSFGDAPFLGSAGGTRLDQPVVAVLPR